MELDWDLIINQKNRNKKPIEMLKKKYTNPIRLFKILEINKSSQFDF